ncbi:DEAD/DEAH box helicase family protein [Streptomyces sp. NPDC087300]|uniref:DEAD/DEAH box helicase family protein n=1 Tax=Streptomyces sp. NPDC087300 TaxID=3365780 RepID=UPI0037F2AE8C
MPTPTPTPSTDTTPAAPHRTLRPDQQAAVDSAARHLKNPGSRGHIDSACGTGKTLIAVPSVGVRTFLALARFS